ncbi:hypothetical protein JGS22_024700 [Streptomyces sp. P38-E01]|uniref:Uncharacterized protein n=1 Tax=Streptomyces tardus TaxID=2780544 RepID=A0A949NBD0_9ACTN|nr:hypothetical protein [Streptomyces tardus]MBU7600738.1 hypothetical protein [Streptomyces tardus]
MRPITSSGAERIISVGDGKFHMPAPNPRIAMPMPPASKLPPTVLAAFAAMIAPELLILTAEGVGGQQRYSAAVEAVAQIAHRRAAQQQGQQPLPPHASYAFGNVPHRRTYDATAARPRPFRRRPVSGGRDAAHAAEAPKVTAFRRKGQSAPTETRTLPAGRARDTGGGLGCAQPGVREPEIFIPDHAGQQAREAAVVNSVKRRQDDDPGDEPGNGQMVAPFASVDYGHHGGLPDRGQIRQVLRSLAGNGQEAEAAREAVVAVRTIVPEILLSIRLGWSCRVG